VILVAELLETSVARAIISEAVIESGTLRVEVVDVVNGRLVVK